MKKIHKEDIAAEISSNIAQSITCQSPVQYRQQQGLQGEIFHYYLYIFLQIFSLEETNFYVYNLLFYKQNICISSQKNHIELDLHLFIRRLGRTLQKRKVCLIFQTVVEAAGRPAVQAGSVLTHPWCWGQYFSLHKPLLTHLLPTETS